MDPVVLVAHALEEHLVVPTAPTGANAMEVLEQTTKAAQARDHRSMAETMADSITISGAQVVAVEDLAAQTDQALDLSLTAVEDPRGQDRVSHRADLALAEQTSTSGRDHNRETGLEDRDSKEDDLNLEEHPSAVTKAETLHKDRPTLDQAYQQDPKTMAAIAVEFQKIVGAAALHDPAAPISVIPTVKVGTATVTVIRAAMGIGSEATAAIETVVSVATVSVTERAVATVIESAARGATVIVIAVTATETTTVHLTVTDLSGLTGLTETVAAVVAAISPSLKRTR